MDNNRIEKKKEFMWGSVCEVVVDRMRKRWIDSVSDYLNKRSFDVRQARKMVNDRNDRSLGGGENASDVFLGMIC